MIEILNIQDIKEYKGFELIYGYYDILAKLPDNATNGDMIKAMFPNAKANVFVKEVGVKGLDTYSTFTKKWWNSPYEGGKDEFDQKLPVGRWVKEDNATSYCSECGELIFTVQNWFKYCPQCGTRMNGEGKS